MHYCLNGRGLQWSVRIKANFHLSTITVNSAIKKIALIDYPRPVYT